MFIDNENCKGTLPDQWVRSMGPLNFKKVVVGFFVYEVYIWEEHCNRMGFYS